jgi:hypothetical protein
MKRLYEVQKGGCRSRRRLLYHFNLSTLGISIIYNSSFSFTVVLLSIPSRVFFSSDMSIIIALKEHRPVPYAVVSLTLSTIENRRIFNSEGKKKKKKKKKKKILNIYIFFIIF